MNNLKNLQIPATLKKYTSIQGANLSSIAGLRQQKLQVAEKTQQNTKSVLEQQIEQTKSQADSLKEENKQMTLTLKNLQTQLTKPQKKEVYMNLESELNNIKSQKVKLNTKLQLLSQELAKETTTLDKPEPIIQKQLNKIRELETQLDESEIKLSEAVGSSDCFKTIIKKLQMEQLRFEKEIEFSKTELQMLQTDYKEVLQYLEESKEAKGIVAFQWKQQNEQLEAQITDQETAISELKEQRDHQLALMEPSQSLIMIENQLEAQQTVKESNIDILSIVKKINIDNFVQFVQRSLKQKTLLRELEDQIQQSNIQLKTLTEQTIDTKVRLNDYIFNMDGQISLRNIENAKHELKSKQLEITQKQFKYQHLIRAQADLQRAIQHVLDLLSIFKAPDCQFQTVQSDPLEFKLNYITKKFGTLGLLLGQEFVLSAALEQQEDLFDFEQMDDFKVEYEHTNSSDKMLTRDINRNVQLDFKMQRNEIKKRTQKIVQEEERKKNDWQYQ
ncbi:Conserved_hypothetical protein [Hexamita inflata]|uniref:Uncharacterized protein n=1 Tax=Hexamita inflata TaxID=28002 RepID=A0AA86UYL1_9EUKA|nr:Conserved hypothetical protein [Hexamita inflata]